MPTDFRAVLLLRTELPHGFIAVICHGRIACVDVALPIRETVLCVNDDASSAGIVDSVV